MYKFSVIGRLLVENPAKITGENNYVTRQVQGAPDTDTDTDNYTASLRDLLHITARRAPVLAKPELNQRLTIVYAKAEQKVAGAMKRRKNSQKDGELLKQFQGQFPPSLLKVMAGETSDTGFHPIALQIGITANAIGIALDKVLSLSEGLIENHKGDGSRYNSPAKRRAEIERMCAYTHDNPCYTYSRDAVKKLLPKDVPTPDLDGVPEAAAGEGGADAAQSDTGVDKGVKTGAIIKYIV